MNCELCGHSLLRHTNGTYVAEGKCTVDNCLCVLPRYGEKQMNDRAILEEVFTYHAPSEEQIKSMAKIRQFALDLADTILDECPACADRTTAIRKVREAVMTANAAIVLKGIV